ncbi:MAG: glutamine--tRNA ligase, partial [Bacteroidales bacterium]|nr:glutamine--tRNA ligase [Bacteroidales bacterium]
KAIDPDDVPEGHDWKEGLNPDSLKVVTAKAEPSLTEVSPWQHFQFERVGYFNVDPDTQPGTVVFNRTVALKDTWAKVAGE